MNTNNECSNSIKMINMVFDLCDLAGNTPEAMQIRDRIMDCFNVNYSQPLIDYLDLAEKYGVPDLKYLEKCIQDHDKYGELQEQIGCPLDVVFKALKEGIYTKQSELDDELELFEVRGIEEKGISVISKFCGCAECDFTRYYEDYKKTWWLKEDKSE